jgi:hypothetical protein
MASFVPVLAFGFVSPWMLWGAALAGIPIVIHLLHRQRYRETTWAAMRFLTAAIRKQSQRMRLEQWLLLAVRTAILLCIALAIAGPTVQSLTAFVPSGGNAPTHRILVLDASLSMGLIDQGHSRIDQARDIARNLVRSSHQGDTWNLIRVGGVSPPAVIRRPTPQSDAVLRELDQLTLLEEVANWPAAFKEVEQLIRDGGGIPRKEVYLLTDLQASNWQSADAAAMSKIRQAVRNLSEGIVHVFPIVSGETANTAITSMHVADGLHLVGKQNLVRVGLTRFGAASPSQTVEFRVDDRVQETRMANLALGPETVIDWSPVLSAGEHRLEARIVGDSLLADNRRGAVINVQDRLPVLLVNGKPSGEPWENATDLLKLALAPDAHSSIAPTVIPESELLSTPLAPYACVFLCNLALITDREARWLTDYLTQGGAVVICVGSQVRIDQYNQALLAEDRAVLPAKLIELVGDPQSTETSFEFDPGDFSHPILKPFQGNPNSGLELTKTFAYLRTEIPPDRGTQVALRFQTGDPAILTAPFGRGRVVLVTTSVDREWSTWAVWGHSFVPLMHEIVRYAAADRWQGRQVLIGEPLTGIVDLDSVRSAVVSPPSGEPVSLEVVQRQVAFDQTRHSGFYELRWGPPASRSVWYAVNVDPIESDPLTWDEKTFKSEFLETGDWQFHSDNMALPTTSTFSAAGTVLPAAEQPWSRALLLAAFWLLLVEQGLAWRFSLGMSVLAIGLAIAVTQSLAGWPSWLTVVSVALVTMMIFLLAHRRGWNISSISPLPWRERGQG